MILELCLSDGNFTLLKVIMLSELRRSLGNYVSDSEDKNSKGGQTWQRLLQDWI